MKTPQAVLQLYRNFYLFTRQCNDRSLKLYIRRRASEDFRELMKISDVEKAKK